MNATPETSAENTAPTPEEELVALKERADLMGIKYSPNIGVDALRKRVTEALQSNSSGSDPETQEAEEGAPAQETRAQIRQRMQRDEMRLIRVRIQNLNPQKKDLQGEYFTVANKYIGEVKKFIPYNETENGYHIPLILLKQLKNRKFLNIKTKRNKLNGQIVVEQNWAPEFAIEELPQLTEKELKQLAAQQAAAAGMVQ